MSAGRLLLAFLLLAAFVSSAPAGKLGQIRDRARGKKSSAAAAKPPAEDRPEDAGAGREDRQPRRSARGTAGALASIVSQVRPRRQQAAVQPQRHRMHPAPIHRHRPQRSPAVFGHLHVSPPICRPAIIQEHHYYAAEPVILEGLIEDPQRTNAQPADVPLSAPFGSATGEVPGVVEPVFSHGVAADMDPRDWLKPCYIRFGMDYAADADDVSRMGFDLLANATSGPGIDMGVRLFRERSEDFRDHLWIGDLNVVYELVPTEWVRPRAGVGVSWLADGYGAEAGLNLTCGADVFLGSVTLAAELDFGTLGETDLFHARATAGILQGENLEWFAGYDHLEIGGVEIRGLVGGLRFRF